MSFLHYPDVARRDYAALAHDFERIKRNKNGRPSLRNLQFASRVPLNLYVSNFLSFFCALGPFRPPENGQIKPLY